MLLINVCFLKNTVVFLVNITTLLSLIRSLHQKLPKRPSVGLFPPSPPY